MLLGWLILGAVVGGIAANTRGFSSASGIICGALLGLFSPLLFLATGRLRPCPSCAERIRPEAAVCRFCHRDVTPELAPVAPEGMTDSEKAQAWRIVLGFMVFMAVMILVGWIKNRP